MVMSIRMEITPKMIFLFLTKSGTSRAAADRKKIREGKTRLFLETAILDSETAGRNLYPAKMKNHSAAKIIDIDINGASIFFRS